MCHTALVEAEPSSDPSAALNGGGPPAYQVSSPDESALVTFAADCGLTFRGRDGPRALVGAQQQQGPEEVEEAYEVLASFEFSSARRRHSVVARCPDGAARVLCKGADDVVFERLAKTEANAAASADTDGCLQRFGAAGLRTLCIADRRGPGSVASLISRVRSGSGGLAVLRLATLSQRL